MSENRILLIENPASLSVDLGRIKIQRQEYDDIHVLPADIAVLCLHHHTITVSANVLKLLSENGATILVTNDQHLPTGLLLPLCVNQLLSQRLFLQIKQSHEQRDRCWAQIVSAKIWSQAKNLRHFKLKGALRLERLSQDVKPGDPRNAEAQASKHYWKYFFNADFKRAKQGAADGINSRLNYGYAVLRAMIARQLVMSGLNPALGVGHRSTQNPFNLADDFIEPYRFLVERHVSELDITDNSFTSKDKPTLLSFIEQNVIMDGKEYRLASAIAESVSSYLRFLEDDAEKLRLPQEAIVNELDLWQ